MLKSNHLVSLQLHVLPKLKCIFSRRHCLRLPLSFSSQIPETIPYRISAGHCGKCCMQSATVSSNSGPHSSCSKAYFSLLAESEITFQSFLDSHQTFLIMSGKYCFHSFPYSVFSVFCIFWTWHITACFSTDNVVVL